MGASVNENQYVVGHIMGHGCLVDWKQLDSPLFEVQQTSKRANVNKQSYLLQ